MAGFGLILDGRFEEHFTGTDHPECVERLVGVRGAFEAAGIPERCESVELVRASEEWLARVHDVDYIREVHAACSRGEKVFHSTDTAVCAESADISREASGTLVSLCRDVLDGKLERGFAAMRPPGHHAERAVAMGFCLFNHVAVAAADLRARGVERVLICDWDVHHGNGTQHIFDEDPDVFFFSCHQVPLYPGTGMAEETGIGAGEGATLNVPLRPGSGDADFLASLDVSLRAAAKKFEPEFVLVSAGFDAHAADPLANLEVSTEAFGEATKILMSIADEHAGGRLVSTLEGGYDLEALAASSKLHVETMLAG